MKCSEARPLLDVLFDGELTAKDAALVLDHLQSCNECKSEWNDLEQVRSTFKEAKNKYQMPAGLMEKVSHKLKTEDRRHNKATPMAAVAACLISIGLLSGSFMQRPIEASTDTLIDEVVSKLRSEPV